MESEFVGWLATWLDSDYFGIPEKDGMKLVGTLSLLVSYWSTLPNLVAFRSLT